MNYEVSGLLLLTRKFRLTNRQMDRQNNYYRDPEYSMTGPYFILSIILLIIKNCPHFHRKWILKTGSIYNNGTPDPSLSDI